MNINKQIGFDYPLDIGDLPQEDLDYLVQLLEQIGYTDIEVSGKTVSAERGHWFFAWFNIGSPFKMPHTIRISSDRIIYEIWVSSFEFINLDDNCFFAEALGIQQALVDRNWNDIKLKENIAAVFKKDLMLILGVIAITGLAGVFFAQWIWHLIK